MRKSTFLPVLMALVIAGTSLSGSSCGKRPAPAPPPVTAAPTPTVEPTPPPPAPTLMLTASPAAIIRGQSSTLSWRTANATEVTIDGGIGTVESTGTRTVSPTSSVTYRARATGAGGTADAEARITVSEEPAVIPPPARAISDIEWFPANAKDAFFDYDSYSLRDDARQALMSSAQALKERSHIRITIEGHADERGSEAYNLALADKRASAAKDFLVSQGIDPSRIDTISYGEEKPFSPGHDEASWQQNRVAHLVMLR